MSGVIDLNCEDYDVRGGSISHDHDGYVFRCTIGPVSDDISSHLISAAKIGTAVRLVFPQQPLLLEHVEIERIGVLCVRIVGRVIDGATRRTSSAGEVF